MHNYITISAFILVLVSGAPFVIHANESTSYVRSAVSATTNTGGNVTESDGSITTGQSRAEVRVITEVNGERYEAHDVGTSSASVSVEVVDPKESTHSYAITERNVNGRPKSVSNETSSESTEHDSWLQIRSVIRAFLADLGFSVTIL